MFGIKKKLVIAGVIAGMILFGSLLDNVCSTKKIANEDGTITTVYRRPVFNIPFIGKKPVRNLPIPDRDVDRIIKTENGNIIIIDNKGDIHGGKEVIIYKPPIIGLALRPGYSYVYMGKPYHCLSLDLLRIGRVYIGPDIGVGEWNFQEDLLIGVSGKLKLADIDILNFIKADFAILGGYDFNSKGMYFGVNVGF